MIRILLVDGVCMCVLASVFLVLALSVCLLQDNAFPTPSAMWRTVLTTPPLMDSHFKQSSPFSCIPINYQFKLFYTNGYVYHIFPNYWWFTIIHWTTSLSEPNVCHGSPYHRCKCPIVTLYTTHPQLFPNRTSLSTNSSISSSPASRTPPYFLKGFWGELECVFNIYFTIHCYLSKPEVIMRR